MEFIKLLFAVTCLGVLVTVVSSAPKFSLRLKRANDLQIMVLKGLVPRINDAKTKMKSFYPFIKRQLQVPPIDLGLCVSNSCLSSKKLKHKLSVAYRALANFQSPLYLAYSYEQKQGPQHDSLFTTLKEISRRLNDTVGIIAHKMAENSFHLPSNIMRLTEGELDHATREFLQTLQTLTVTDDLVKRYRNYVIMYTLNGVIKVDISPCIMNV